MKLSITLFALLIFLSTSLKAQEVTKKTVGVMPFRSVEPADLKYAAELQDMVTEILTPKKTITSIDRSKIDDLIKEQTNQKAEESMDAATFAQQGKILGANEIISGTLTYVNAEKKTESQYNWLTKQNNMVTSYSGVINFSIQVIDASTGKVIQQKTITNSGTSSNYFSIIPSGSESQAISDVIKGCRKMIEEFLNSSYPPNIKISQMEDMDKKGFPVTVLVVGADDNLKKGDVIMVNEEEEVSDGNGGTTPRIRNIGELKVKELQGAITVCNVSKGKETILAKKDIFNKLKLVIQTTPKK